MNAYRLSAAAFVSAALLALPAPAGAAEAYDNCTGFIPSVPAVIASQGVWCLNKDLSFNPGSGNAITVNASNVTIDCNDFKLGNLSAGTGTTAVGIRASNRRNLTIRGCNIRGFEAAVLIDGTGGGHVIEDNRIEGTTGWGLRVTGDGDVIRGNLILDIGPSTNGFDHHAAGIDHIGTVEISGNTVSGVQSVGSGWAEGISLAISGEQSVIRGNIVRGVVGTGVVETGIGVYVPNVSVHENDVIGRDAADSRGLYCNSPPVPMRHNVVGRFAQNVDPSCGPYLDNIFFGPPS